ncbi:hypothetical protein C0991_011321 [Blastosporella zonata]|nr:hypothetical protein C0991_011321 [Blastosporella zonata]
MSLLTVSDLLELKYPVLQQIAKREGVKANAKKNVMVDLLIKKYPEGVRRHPLSSKLKNGLLDDDSKLSSRSSKRQRVSPTPDESVRSWVKGVLSAQNSPAHSSAGQAPSPGALPLLSQPSGRAVISALPSPPGGCPLSPGPLRGLSLPRDRSPPPNVYCFKGARRARRDLVNLANGSAVLHADLDETEALLKYATKTYDQAAQQVNGFVCMRRAMQTLHGTMKRDRTVLDGTGQMHLMDVDRWRAYAAEEDRLRQEEQDQLDMRLYNEHVARAKAALSGQVAEDKGEMEEKRLNHGGSSIGSKRKRSMSPDESDDALEYI